MPEEEGLTNRQWLLKARPTSNIEPSLFEKSSKKLSKTLGEGHVLAKVCYLSFDPTQRAWMAHDTYIPAIKLGEVVRAFGVAQVIESRHKSFSKGDMVLGPVMWQEYVLFDPSKAEDGLKFDKIPGHMDPIQFLSLALTGMTGYFGMIEVGNVKKGDVVLVSGAAGATGSVAAQVAKAMGAGKVVGIAGGPAKCEFLTDKLKLDGAIDYKKDNVKERLREICPDGIDVFFDNVGGPLLDTVLENHLAMHARIVICGAISQYNKSSFGEWYGIKHASSGLLLSRAKMEGFIVLDHSDRALEGMMALSDWVQEGKIYLETDMQSGFENIPTTLKRIFTGANIGKQMLKLCDPPLPKNTSMIEKIAMKGIGYYYFFWRNAYGFIKPAASRKSLTN